MSDMIVNLYDLKDEFQIINNLSSSYNINIKRALSPDRSKIFNFVKNNFKEDYSDECLAAFSNNPVTCYIAVKEKKLIGFAFYEATAKNFFGPISVLDTYQHKGVGKALLLKCLYSMKEMGYAYAIIGWPTKSAINFYKHTVNALTIEGDSTIYSRLINY